MNALSVSGMLDSALARRLRLAHLPTPLWHHDGLDRLIGAEIWVKRDDMTLGAAAGNKIRKLEFLFHEARDAGATTVITCGAVQSNHARATALVARELGLDAILYLRTAEARPAISGNLLLDALAGADVRFISPEEYRERDALMAQTAEQLVKEGRLVYIIPEGGSNACGALGYVAAMEEIGVQLQAGLAGGRPFGGIAHASGSGGTLAGCVLGARHYGVANTVHAFAVCDDRAYFERIATRIVAMATELLGTSLRTASFEVHDEWRGPAYGTASPEQLKFLREVARSTGLVLDPVYTGKALYGLAQMSDKPGRILFLHTGGLPGLLAQNAWFEA